MASLSISTRYEIHEEIGRGGMGVVYRVTDRLSGEVVALKQVTTGETGTTGINEAADLRLALANEFRTLASLRHPNIIPVVDYGFDEHRQPYFTMYYVDNANTITEAAADMTTQQIGDLLLQTLNALVYLHRRNVIHRDLKPGNILVQGGQVKVMDFGLSLLKSESSKDIFASTVGTLAYMSPELLQGEDYTVSSDLYAVGIVAYELCTGQHPYMGTQIGALVTSILTKQPDLSLVDPLLAPIIGKLLQKDPQSRYQSATDVINDLAAALSTNATDESEAIRESFLQAAQFVGRRTELTQMTEAMQHATDGKGSVWLVGGESGVGKSRLLEEVRTRALVDGALVMRGQAVLEGGGPYQVWRGPLELLLLYSDLSADEGAMMKMFVPDLEKMVGHTFADMPMTEPADMQKQMFDLIGKLIRRFDYPVMIVLEDMQWAGSESIQFLNYLTKTIISEAALVVVCSYRNDEAPDLPQRVTGASEIQLSRLGRDTMTALSVSMLGEQVRESSNLVDLIARETEGNPYFIVEVVRALAEEAGRLDSIRDMTLPTSVFAEGMKTVIQRRLQNVKPEYYPLLKLAAIAGRLLDLKLLTNLQPHMDLTKWLNATAAVSVVEVVGGQWRFAHDKLRERVLEDLTDHERPRLHRLVAETIEMCYPDDTMRAAALAYLWAVAGDAEKELHWSQVAAQNALRTNANTEAEHYYRRALELNDERYDLQRELEMQIELAVAMTATKGYPHPDVEAAYDRAHDLANHTGELSPIFRSVYGLTNVYSSRGNLKLAEGFADSLLEMTEHMESEDAVMVANAMKGLIMIRRGRISESMGYVRKSIALYDVEKHRQLGIRFGFDPGLGGLAYGTIALSVMGQLDASREWQKRAFDLADELGYPFSRIFALYYAGVIGNQAMGNFTDMVHLADEVIDLAQRYDYPFFYAMAHISGGWARARAGDTATGLQWVEFGLEEWTALGANPDDINWGTILAHTRLMTGDIAAAEATIYRILGDFWNHGEGLGIPFFFADLALAKAAHGAAAYDVIAALERSLHFAQAVHSLTYELVARTAWAKYLQQNGDFAGAVAMLKPTYDRFTEGHDQPVLQEAKTVLDALTTT